MACWLRVAGLNLAGHIWKCCHGIAHCLMRAASCRVGIPGVAYVTSGHMEHTRSRVWMFSKWGRSSGHMEHTHGRVWMFQSGEGCKPGPGGSTIYIAEQVNVFDLLV